MKLEINDPYLFLDTTYQIQKSLSQAYPQIEHTVKVYNLRHEIAQFKQGDQPLAIYYAYLKKLWEELDHYTTFCFVYPNDVSAYNKHVEEIQVFEFLIVLSLEYDQLKAQILNMNLSSLNEVYAHVHREEER